ncbi:MAG: ABC transporter ATP-binding protein [Anaerolineae bacterium]|nr:ABC transporter ATP-binding protein [Anaerolineae bacterium]
MGSDISPNTLKRPLDFRRAVHKNRLLGLWRMMEGYRRFYLGAVASMAVSAWGRSATFWLLRFVIDETLTNGVLIDRLYLIGLAFVGLAALQGAFSYLQGTWSARTAEGVTLRLRNYLFDHLQRLPFKYHDHAKTGETLQRVTSDVDAVRRFYADQAIGIGRIAVLFGVNIVMLVQMNWQLALLSLTIMPVVIVMSYVFFGRVSKAYERYQEQDAVVSTRLQENLSGVRVVRAFARQAHEIEKFERENWEKYQRGKRLLIMHSLYWPISDVLCAGQTLLVMAVGAIMTIQGTISVGTYMAVNGMVVWIIWPLRNLGRLIVQVSTGLVSYQRVADIIVQEREDVQTGKVRITAPVAGEVVFEGVGFAYEAPPQLSTPEPGSNGRSAAAHEASAAQESTAPDAEVEPAPVLHDITFRCAPGEVVALLGSTGSGKTSIINLLLRFYDYQAGSIRLDGVELTEYPIAELRQQIGIVEQEPFLFSRSIRDNIVYGVDREVSEEEVEAAARAAAIHDIILGFPKGYDTLVGEKGVTLSGGQRQRVAIARTLLRNPRILILDDATSSVDTETEAQIRKALELLMRDRTSFVIAHRIQSVMNADLILVLDKGRIVQRGTHDELIGQAGMYRQIYDLQARIEQEVEREVAYA